MAGWQFDSFKRWDPGAYPAFSDAGPPEALTHLTQAIWEEPELRNTEPVLLLIAESTVALLDVQFVVGVDATFRRDPVVRIRWRTESDPTALGDAFGEAFHAWLERDALEGGLYRNATAEWAARERDTHLARALDLVRLLDGPAQLVPIPVGDARARMESAMAARMALRLSGDQLQPALVWAKRGLGEWMDQGFHVLEAAPQQPLGSHPGVAELAQDLLGDLESLARGARENGGGSLYVGLQRQVVFEQVLAAALPAIDVVDPPAALDLLRDLDESERDRLLMRLAPAFRERLGTLGEPCVAEGREVRGPGGVLRFRSPDLASFQELEGLHLPVAVRLAFATQLPPAEAVQVLPEDLSRWPGPTLAWLATHRLDHFLARWRPMAATAAGAAVARELAWLVPEPDALPLDLLWRADPDGVAERHGPTLAAYCQALAAADLPQVPPTAVDADWWLDQAPRVIEVLPEGLALLIPLIEQAEAPLSQETCRELWEAATPHQQAQLHPLMAGVARLAGVVQRTFHTWLETGVDAWLECLPEPDTQTLWWVLGSPLDAPPEAPLLERDPRALYWRYVAYRMDLQERFTPLPVGQRLSSRLPPEWWRVLTSWPAERHLGPVLFDLWVHGPDGILGDVRPPPDVESLTAQLVRSGALARPQHHAAWDGLSAHAEAWIGAWEWAHLFLRDPGEALRRLQADADLQTLARKHGWNLVDSLDPRRGWATTLWSEIVDLVPGDARRERLLASLPDHLRLHLVQVSAGLVRPTWVEQGA